MSAVQPSRRVILFSRPNSTTHRQAAFTLIGPIHLSDATQIVLLNDGSALVIGNSGTDLYDWSAKRFTATGAMTVPRSKFGGALLPDGRVLIAGGQAGGPFGTRVTTTQIYDPGTGRFFLRSGIK